MRGKFIDFIIYLINTILGLKLKYYELYYIIVKKN